MMREAEIEDALESAGLVAAAYRDVTPTWHDDGPHPVCPINYPEECKFLLIQHPPFVGFSMASTYVPS